MKKIFLLLLLVALFVSCKKSPKPSGASTSHINTITGRFIIRNNGRLYIIHRTLTLSYIGYNAVKITFPDFPYFGSIVLTYSGNNCTKISFYDSTNSNILCSHNIAYNSNNQVTMINSYQYYSNGGGVTFSQEYTFQYNGLSLSKIFEQSSNAMKGLVVYYNVTQDPITNDITRLRINQIDTAVNYYDTFVDYTFTNNATQNKQSLLFPVLWLIEGTISIDNANFSDITTAIPYFNTHQVINDSASAIGLDSGLSGTYQYLNDNNGNTIQRIDQGTYSEGIDTVQYSYK